MTNRTDPGFPHFERPNQAPSPDAAGVPNQTGGFVSFSASTGGAPHASPAGPQGQYGRVPPSVPPFGGAAQTAAGRAAAQGMPTQGAGGYSPLPVTSFVGTTRVPVGRRPGWKSFVLAGVASLVIAAVAVAGPIGVIGAATARPSEAPSAQPSARESTRAQQAPATATSVSRTYATDAQTRGVALITTSSSAGEGAGTGMVISSDGIVLTNYHVVQGSTSVTVKLAATAQTYRATVLGHDADSDGSVLKLAGASGLETVRIDPDAVHTGDAVTAVGNAGGQGFLTAAPGLVSDTDTTITVSNDSVQGSETLRSVYETTAKAQPGDSGGPLFDAENEVTAITSAGETAGRRGGQTVTVSSYAIPIGKAMEIANQIVAGQASGTVKVGPNAYLGIMVTTGRDGSALVSGITDGTPAAKAGITAGSQITSIGGMAVSSSVDISKALAARKPGDTVNITWTDHSGAQRQSTVTLGKSPIN